MAPPKKASGPVMIAPLSQAVTVVTIRGTAPLIVNKWSEKAIQQMLDKHMQVKAIKETREAKDPDEIYEASLYRLPDGRYGFPATAFKKAIVGAARFYEGLTMVMLRQAIYVPGAGPEQLIPINGTPEQRRDMVKVGNDAPDIRFRGMFPEWNAVIAIRYLTSMLSEEALISLVNTAGMGGIGEWRPSRCDSGLFGTWEVTGTGDVGVAA